jgi:hypothetical protein
MIHDLMPAIAEIAATASRCPAPFAGLSAHAPLRFAVLLHDDLRRACRARLQGIPALQVLGHSLVAVICFVPGVLLASVPVLMLVPALRRLAYSHLQDAWEEIERAAAQLAPRLPASFSRPLFQ